MTPRHPQEVRVRVWAGLQVLCSRAADYNSRGVLCDGTVEGPLLRNPGNHNRNIVERLPTTAEVLFAVNLPDYDTGAMDRTANMSFRNTLEGIGTPELRNTTSVGNDQTR